MKNNNTETNMKNGLLIYDSAGAEINKDFIEHYIDIGDNQSLSDNLFLSKIFERVCIHLLNSSIDFFCSKIFE